jgi:hypothetical protein
MPDCYKPQKSLGKEVIPSGKEWIGKIPSLAASEIFHEIMANSLYWSEKLKYVETLLQINPVN